MFKVCNRYTVVEVIDKTGKSVFIKEESYLDS